MLLIAGDAKRPRIRGTPVPFLASPTLTKDAVSTGLAAQLGWKIDIGGDPVAVETGWTFITSVPQALKLARTAGHRIMSNSPLCPGTRRGQTITWRRLSALIFDQGQRNRITAASERAAQSTQFGLLTPAMHIDVGTQAGLPSGACLIEAAELQNLEPRLLRRRFLDMGQSDVW